MSSYLAKQFLTADEYVRWAHIVSWIHQEHNKKPEKLFFIGIEEHVLQHFGVEEDIIFSQEAIGEIVKYSEAGFHISVIKYNRCKELIAIKNTFQAKKYADALEKWEKASLQKENYETELALFNKMIAQRQADHEQAKIAQLDCRPMLQRYNRWFET